MMHQPQSRSALGILLPGLILALVSPSGAAAQALPWESLDGGVADEVYALARFQGDLIVGGTFESAGGVPAKGIARWDGTAWHDMGNANVGTVTALLVHHGVLYVAGGFINAADDFEIGVLAWDGAQWAIFDDANEFVSIDDIIIFNDEVVIAADRRQPGHPFNRDRIVMRWDGAAWQPLGDEFNSPVTTLAVYNGELIAAGEFDRNGLYDINHIARWDGAAWQRLGNGLAHSGLNGAPLDLEVFDGRLFAAGGFLTAGGRLVRGIARWNGTEWRGVDGGANQDVRCLAVYQNDLVAGGTFTRIGGVNASRVARWNADHGWRPLGKGLNSDVLALSPWSEGLAAGGRFWKSGPRDVDFVALWPRE